MANEVAGLLVEISADSRALTTELQKANQQVDTFSSKATKSFGLIGTAVATAAVAVGTLLVKNIGETIQQLDKLGDTAENIGLTTGALQKLQFQAEQAGSSAEGVTQAFSFMLNSIADAANGSQQAAQAFAQLGLNANQLKQLRPEQQFQAIAQAFHNVGNAADRVNLARSIFGRGGTDLVNLLNSNLQKTGQLFDRLNLGISEDGQKAIDAYDKSVKLLDSTWEGFKNQIAAGVAPAFNAVIAGINKTIDEFGGLGNVADSIARGIVTSIKTVADALVTLEKPFKALGVVQDAVELAGAKIGVTLGQISFAFENMKGYKAGDPLPLPGLTDADKERDRIANDIVDQRAAKLQQGIQNFSQVDVSSKIEKGLDNIQKGFDKVGNAAETAKQKVQGFASITGADGRTITIQGGQFANSNSNTNNSGRGFGLPAPTQDELRATQAALDNYKKTGMLPDDMGALSQIARGQFSLFNNGGSTAQGTGKGFGTITDATGRTLSTGNAPPPQKVEVTVTPDKQAFIETVVNSPQMNDKISQVSKSNTIDAATVDPRGKN